MRTVKLGSTGISCSVLGFGCSSVLGRSGRRESLRALEAAWDSGITLYDTARSYGYGESEALVGEFLIGRRDQAVIATKFGILPVRPPLWKRMARPAARAVIGIAPSLRGRARKGAGQQVTENHFTVEMLQTSIETSLRKLKTGYVDLLFLHSPPTTVLGQDGLLAAMEKLVSAGKVRAAGISGEPEVIGATIEQRPAPLRVLQFPCTIFDSSTTRRIESSFNTSPDAPPFGAIANQPFGGALRIQECRELLLRVAKTSEVNPVLREKLRNVDDGVLSDVVLNVVLSRSPVNAVITSMMRLPHVEKNVAAITESRFTFQELREIDDLTAAAAH